MRTISLLLLFVFLFQGVIAFASDQVSDDLIYDNVRRKLANDPDVKGGAMQVEVKDGVVTIAGQVEKDKWKAKAEKLAKKVKGVKSVINQLVVKPRGA